MQPEPLPLANAQRPPFPPEARLRDTSLSAVFRSLPVAALSLGVDGTVLEAGGILLDGLGYRSREVIGRDFSDLVQERDRRTLPEFLADVLARGGAAVERLRLLGRDGTAVETPVAGCAVYDGSGGFVCIHCLLPGLREHRPAEESRRREAERLALALEALDDDIWDMQRDGDHGFFSPRTAERLGYPASALDDPGKFLERHLHPEDRRYLREMIRTGLAERRDDLQFEFRMRARDGSWRWFLTRGKVVERGEDGSPRRIIGVNSDITGQKQLVGELLSLQKRLQSVIDAMPSILVGVDAAGAVTLWNEEARRALGIGPERALGRRFQDLHPVLAGLGDSLRAALLLGEPRYSWRREAELAGGTRVLDVLIYPYAAEGVGGAMVRIDDATERSRVDQMLAQSEKMMSIGALSAGIAHEINNPLGGVLQGLQNVERRLFADLPGNREAAGRRGLELDLLHAYLAEREVPRLLDGIRRSGNQAAAIVSNMLQFARSGDGETMPVDIARLIADTVQLAAVDYDLDKNWDFRNIAITLELEPELPRVPAQASGIEQVLMNLLGNAAQALQDGGGAAEEPRIVISARREPGRLRIDVTDNGPGMPPEVSRRVFEPFFTTKPPGVGTGLGLAVCHHIVTEVHRGELTVESRPGRGAAFTIRLPLEVVA